MLVFKSVSMPFFLQWHLDTFNSYRLYNDFGITNHFFISSRARSLWLPSKITITCNGITKYNFAQIIAYTIQKVLYIKKKKIVHKIWPLGPQMRTNHYFVVHEQTKFLLCVTAEAHAM